MFKESPIFVKALSKIFQVSDKNERDHMLDKIQEFSKNLFEQWRIYVLVSNSETNGESGVFFFF